jgi:hypothetical protein
MPCMGMLCSLVIHVLQVELLEGGSVLAGELGIRIPDPAAYDVFAPLVDRLVAALRSQTRWNPGEPRGTQLSR